MKKLGFTLIEMIIVLALTVIILVLASSIFATGSRIFSESDAKSTLQIEAQTIEEKLSKLGMESIGIESIKDEFGNQTTGSGVQITEVLYSELDLTDINGGDVENKWLAISEMTIDCYEEKDNIIAVSTIPATIIKYDKNQKKLYTIDGEELIGNVESVRIKPIDLENPKGTFKNTNSIAINIMLSKKTVYREFKYPVLITVKSRNNFLK
jgi:prepilin-type N-terminal cleavage/methylation domain-containing protein